jgi:hypothetical protein
MLVTFAYVLALGGRRARPLSVLDWGGGFGHSPGARSFGALGSRSTGSEGDAAVAARGAS